MSTMRTLIIVTLVVVVCVIIWLTTYWPTPDGDMTKQSAIPRQAALPDHVRDAIQARFPEGTFIEVEYERRVIRLYTVALTVDGVEFEVLAAPDGTILEIEREIHVDAAPESVRASLSKSVGLDHVTELEEKTVLATYSPVALTEPRTEYEADYRDGVREQEVIVSAEGEIMNTPIRVKVE